MSENDVFWRHRHLLQVGDGVRVCADSHFPKPEDLYHPIGTVGEIVGFAITSISRTSARGFVRSGIYLDPGRPFVRFKAGVIRNFCANSLQLVNEVEYGRRMEQSLLENQRLSSLNNPFVSQLPDTEIWEGDIVRPKPCDRTSELLRLERVKCNSIPGIPDAYMVADVSFRRPGEIVGSLDYGPYFGIGDRFLKRWNGGFFDWELELVERGNFWRRAHDEPLIFKDLEEESFWAWMVGETEAVPAPERPKDPWSRDYLSECSVEVQAQQRAKWYSETAALSCVSEGKGHGIQSHHAFEDVYDSRPYVWCNVLRFKDEDLGRRVAAATAHGFRIPAKDWEDDLDHEGRVIF